MIKLGEIGKIIIKDRLKNQIDYYHKENPGKEWSGILFFKHTGGNIEDLKDLEFTATDIYIMDIGSESFTSFEMDKEIVKAYDVIGDDELESLTGFCHSHANMSAFYSGTDIKELEDNAESYFFYVSLVVNTSDRYVCKAIIPSTAKTVSEYSVRNSSGEVKLVKREETVKQFLDGDLDIVFETENNVEAWVIERFNQVKENKAAKDKLVYSREDYKHVSQGWTKEKKDSALTKYVGSPLDLARAFLSLDAKTYIPFGNLLKTLDSLNEENFNEYLILFSGLLYDLCDEVWNDGSYDMYSFRINQAVLILEKHSTDKTENLNNLIIFLKSITDE